MAVLGKTWINLQIRLKNNKISADNFDKLNSMTKIF
jgi:hypothetical protein